MKTSTKLQTAELQTAEMVIRQRTIIDVEITGLTTILLHKGTTITKKSRRSDESYAEEWKKTCYLDDDGHVCLPDLNIEAMILASGRSRKVGKHFLKKYIAYGVIVEPQSPLLLVNGKPVTLADVEQNGWIYVTGAVVQGNRVDRARTMLPAGWTCRFQIGLDSLLLKSETILAILTD